MLSCYNKYQNCVKSLDQVINEVNLGFMKRNADTISILRGELTLYPNTLKIISYIKRKDVTCQLCTNGLISFNDNADTFIDDLIESGPSLYLSSNLSRYHIKWFLYIIITICDK